MHLKHVVLSISHCRISSSQVNVKFKPNQLVEKSQRGRRESSIASVQTVDIKSTEDRLIWPAVRKDREDVGISAAAFEVNRDFILRWLSHATETGAFEEKKLPGSEKMSIPESPSDSNLNMTEEIFNAPGINASMEVYRGTDCYNSIPNNYYLDLDPSFFQGSPIRCRLLGADLQAS